MTKAPKLRLVDELWERWEQALGLLNHFPNHDDPDRDDRHQHVFQRLDDRPNVVTEIVNGKERKRKKPRPGRTGEEIGSFIDGGISELFEKLVNLNDEKAAASTSRSIAQMAKVASSKTSWAGALYGTNTTAAARYLSSRCRRHSWSKAHPASSTSTGSSKAI